MFAGRRPFIALLLFVLVLLAACGGQDPLEPTASPQATSTTPDPNAVSAGPQVFVFPTETEKRLIWTESIPQNNCDGSAETSDTVERSHSVLRTLELGSGITVSAEGRAGIPGVGEVAVGAAVASYYQVSYGTADTITRSVTVAAKEGSHIEHTIRHYEIWEKGELLIVAGPVNQQLPYTFRKDFSIEKLPPANIGCPTTPVAGGVDPQPPIGPSEQPPPGPTATATVQSTEAEPPTAIVPAATSIEQAEAGGACGPEAFDSLMTSDPLFRRPAGMQSGWLSSDPATVQLADGTQMRFDTQFVLVVEDVPQVQVLGVSVKSSGEANTFGCWFLAADAQFARPAAERDFQKKIDGGNRAVMYRASSAGFEPINP